MMEQNLQQETASEQPVIEQPALDTEPQSLPEDEVERLAALLRKRARARAIWHWTMALSGGSVVFSASIAVLMAFWFIFARHHIPHIVLDPTDWSGTLSAETQMDGTTTMRFGAPGLLFVGLSALGCVAARRVWRRQERETRRLAELNDLRTVGTLAQAREWDDPGIRQIAEESLVQLLPRLQASDAGLLNERQHANLRKALWCDNEELRLAILRAFEQIGDGSDVEDVEKLAAGDVEAAKSIEVQKAAQTCLPYLRRRAEQEQARLGLLRPAESKETEPTLLRAASGTSETEPERLLRPSAEG